MMFTNVTSDAINTSQKGVYVYMCEGTNICYECVFRMRRVTLLIHLRRVSMCKRARVLTYVPTVCGRVSICILMSMLMRILICMLMCVVICMLMRIPTGLCRYQRKCIFFWTS